MIQKTHEVESWSTTLPSGLLDTTTAVSTDVSTSTFVVVDPDDNLILNIEDISDPAIEAGTYIIDVTVTFANGDTNT